MSEETAAREATSEQATSERVTSGGTASGGTASGGTASGGTASDGTASGGTASGGTASGGTGSGGTASGRPGFGELADDALPALGELRLGRYRHYKGNLYEVLHVARHSETLEPLVVYRALYGDRGVWVRPLAMFVEDVVVGGRPVPRFAPLLDD